MAFATLFLHQQHPQSTQTRFKHRRTRKKQHAMSERQRRNFQTLLKIQNVCFYGKGKFVNLDSESYA